MIRPQTKTLQNLLGRLLCLSLLVATVGGCSPKPATIHPERLHLLVDSRVGCQAILGGERYSFAVDVVDTVARRYGRKLLVTSNLPTDSIRQALLSGKADMAVVPRSARADFHKFTSERLYTSEYALLMPRWAARNSGVNEREVWNGKRVLSDPTFHTTATYRMLLENGAVCDTTNYDAIEMAKMVVGGKADAIISERSDAELIRFLYRNITEVATIEEPCEVILIFASPALKEEFRAALAEFSTTQDYASMVDLYFGPTSIAERFTQLTYRPTRVVDGISVWDSQLRHISSKVGVDWRLMSAIAYHETRFRHNLTSHRGAVGLMQVTPIAAEDLNMGEDYDLSDITNNITLAAKLLRRNSRALGFGDFPTTDDGIAIMVASYNCGITRTLEAQRLVEAGGGDPDSWQEVAEMFVNMNSSEWLAQSESRMGRFRDAHITIAYTNGVMSLYNTYRSAIE